MWVEVVGVGVKIEASAVCFVIIESYSANIDECEHLVALFSSHVVAVDDHDGKKSTDLVGAVVDSNDFTMSGQCLMRPFVELL